MPPTAHDGQSRYTRQQAARIAITARLGRSDWHEMTQAAQASPKNPANLDKWRAQAREENPRLDDEQIDRMAELLRAAYFRELGRRSAASRRARSSGEG